MARPHRRDNTEGKSLTSVMEDYLKSIFDLNREKRVVRVKDIAHRLSVKMPTVTSMLKTLNNRGLVNYQKYEYVELTGEGAEVGREMCRRHAVLLKFLTEILKIEAATAAEEACKMEHALCAATLDSLTDFMAFIQICPRAGQSWLQNFEGYRIYGCGPEKCRSLCGNFSREFKDQIDTTPDVAAIYLEEPGDEI